MPTHRLAAVSVVAALLPPTIAQQAPPSPELAEVAVAYAAKVVASALFVSGRTLEGVLAEELAPDDPIQALVRPLLKIDVDERTRSVTCSLGPAKATAVATANLGCTLVRGAFSPETLRSRRAPDLADLRPDPRTTDWPLGDRLPPPPFAGVDAAALDKAITSAFVEPPSGPRVRTRAVVVVHRGQLVAERYAEGYRPDMPLPGWSMTKTIVNALVGIRVEQGQLSLDAPLQVPEWTADPADPRNRLRLSDLLTMSAGLRWNESYEDPASDALRMLFRSSDHGGEYARQPQDSAPGARFQYSSGSSNLVCRILRRTFPTDLEYWAFPRTALFMPLGMRSAVLETDPSGTFVGSSYGFATARDWARFGLLYAQDGKFGDRRILPVGWVARSAAPHAQSRGRSGSHVWLNADPDGDGPAARAWPDLPANLIRLDGHEGQYVTVFPTEQVVVVRLGCTKAGGFDLSGFLRAVLEACSR